MSAEEYLNHVRSLSCAFCHAPPPSEPHHYGPGGMGTKCSDMRVVNLCRRCHGAFHDTRAIPPFDVERTKLELLKSQVTLLVDWIERLENRGALFDMTKPRRR